MSLSFLSSLSLRRLGLPEYLARKLCLLFLYFDFHVFTDARFKFYFEQIL